MIVIYIRVDYVMQIISITVTMTVIFYLVTSDIVFTIVGIPKIIRVLFSVYFAVICMNFAKTAVLFRIDSVIASDFIRAYVVEIINVNVVGTFPRLNVWSSIFVLFSINLARNFVLVVVLVSVDGALIVRACF